MVRCRVWTPAEKLGEMTTDKQLLDLAALLLPVTLARVVLVKQRD